jgi:hypothetical protein
MWAFTSRNPGLDLRAATMFAAVSRALKGYNDDLSERALFQSKRLLKEATELLANQPQDLWQERRIRQILPPIFNCTSQPGSNNTSINSRNFYGLHLSVMSVAPF